jgi:hypothetical protein
VDEIPWITLDEARSRCQPFEPPTDLRGHDAQDLAPSLDFRMCRAILLTRTAPLTMAADDSQF